MFASTSLAIACIKDVLLISLKRWLYATYVSKYAFPAMVRPKACISFRAILFRMTLEVESFDLSCANTV